MHEFFSYESNQLISTCLPLVGESKIENVPCKRRCLQNITNNETRPCSAKEFQTSEPSFVGSCDRNHEGVDSQPVECELSFNSGSALSSTELLLYSLMRLAFRVSTFSKHHSFGSYHNISTIISKVLGANFSAAAIRRYFPRVSRNLLNRKIGKENGVVRWSFFAKETDEFLAIASDILKNTLKNPSILSDSDSFFLSDNLKKICRRSVTSNVDAQICHDSSFPTQFRLFTETNPMFLSNWTPWYNPKHETIHLYSFQQSPGYADKEVVIDKSGERNFRSEGYDRNKTVISAFAGLPEQISSMKWLTKLLEIAEKCQLCNGCGNSDHFKDLLSAGETSIFKKKDGRDGVLQEQQR